MPSPAVPFLDLRAAHEPLRPRLRAALDEALDSSAFAGGPFVERFESEFARFCGSRHAVGVGSGTEALWLALTALGVGSGDEVITSPATFMATAEAITFCGATPVFADIDPRTHTLDPEAVEAAITPRTRAIIPVHLYGQMADMDPILAIARRHGLRVIEDACQAHGAEYHGRRAGTLGDAGCFSFYPGKNLGAIGEAGAVVTDQPELAEAVATLREHGQTRKYHHRRIGWNARMDGLQALVLSVKLEGLSEGNQRRQLHARRYDELLAGAPEVVAPSTAEGRTHVFHLYVVRVADRDRVLAELARRGVMCGIHYPVPVHLQPAYRGLCYREGSLPHAEQGAREVLSLPMFPELAASQLERVAHELRDVLARPVRLELT